MKIAFSFLFILLSGHMLFGQYPDNSDKDPHHTYKSEKITSGLYRLLDPNKNHIMMSGSTTHFSDMTLRYAVLDQSDGQLELRSDQEQILIIKEGEAKVKLGELNKIIGPNSVFFLLPGEAGSVSAQSPKMTYYRMTYTATTRPGNGTNNLEVSSFIIDYNNLPFREHDKGGVHRYFNRSTGMLPYYEMHVTTLNPGIQSHPPHTHEAAEIILIIKGETEEEIDAKRYRGQPGDLYFLASDVPHAIRNVGDTPCQYFAFQWGASLN